METINAIETAISEWSQIRWDAEDVIALLDQGNCFQITREQYETWTPLTPEYFHVYPAVFDNVLKFVIVDGVTDQQTEINYDYVFTVDYTYGAPAAKESSLLGDANITVNEGLERAFRWTMGKNQWVTNQVETEDGVFQAFQVPFSDLTGLFADEEVDLVYVVFGLKVNGDADLILWNEFTDFRDPEMVADVSIPVPPFGIDNPIENYQLLVQS